MNKVFVVMGGWWDYEGFDEESMRVCGSYEEALTYAAKLKTEWSFDYARILEREVE